MKKFAFALAALVIGSGVALAKDAKDLTAPKAMSDSEMEKVVAGDPGNGNAAWNGNYSGQGNGSGFDNGQGKSLASAQPGRD